MSREEWGKLTLITRSTLTADAEAVLAREAAASVLRLCGGLEACNVDKPPEATTPPGDGPLPSLGLGLGFLESPEEGRHERLRGRIDE